MINRRHKLGTYNSSFSKLHRESSWHFWLRLVRRLIAVGVVFTVVYFLLFSSFFTIKKVEVVGYNLVPEASLKEDLQIKDNIFLIPANKIINNLKLKYPVIDEVAILRGIPDSIRVEINEFKPELIWRRNNSQGYVNSSGVFFYPLKDIKLNDKTPQVWELVVGEVESGQKVVTSSFITMIKVIKDEMQAISSLTFDHVELGTTSFIITVKTKENIDIIFAADEDLDRQIDYLRTAVEKRRDKISKKIDVRIPRWIYVE